MIRVDSILIQEFRGIRELKLDFKGKNYAVCGPNGTGKSGVVDALEFALTGRISRLSGEGKGEVSLKQHGPHVDFRNKPEKARVTVVLTVPTLGKTVTVERNAKDPGSPKIEPRDPDVVALLEQLTEHPEVVLSRRELIRYVLATPGNRAREVQELLRLDRVEQVRVGLQKIANTAERQIPVLLSAVKDAGESLLRSLAITEMSSEKVLVAANAQRTILELPHLTELTATTSLKDGLAVPTPVKPQAIAKAQCRADIEESKTVLEECFAVEMVERISEAVTESTNLSADPASSLGMSEENFYKVGLSLVEEEECPFCDTPWEVEALRKHVQAKVDGLQQFSAKRKALAKKIAPLTNYLRRLGSSLGTLVRYGAIAKPPLTMQVVSDYAESCRVAANQLDALLPFEATITTLKQIGVIPAGLPASVTGLEEYVNGLPDPNKQDAAREFLTVAQERLEVWRECKRKHKVATEHAQVARKISDAYGVTSDKLLTGLYESVEDDFAGLYRFINRADEDTFSAKLTPSFGKLGFDVDFYGRGFFPPGAYHSEGHQDGMGLCLYLALMRHLQGADFTFAVLDDVLMSVDTGHRREICALLKKEFPGTQFILTTHDPVWLKHMKTESLITGKGGIQFRTWTVDQGPTVWHERDVWTEIDGYLANSDVRSAAGLLRHYLEYYSAELCHRLRVPVEFRSDGQYQLGELLPPAINHLRKLYKNAKESANSWNQRELVATLEAREIAFGKLAQTSNAEQWQVNVAVHYNSWENLAQADFVPVAKAYRELLEGFSCPDCHELLHVLPDRETPESLRCDCGKTNLNLRKKS